MKSFSYLFLNLNGVYRPYVPLHIQCVITGKIVRGNGLLDTGADTCQFPSTIPKVFGNGLKIEGQEPKTSMGLGGVGISSWNHKFKIGLLDPEEKKVVKWTDEIEVGCVEHDRLPILLGTNTFLNQFRINFDYPNKVVVLSWSVNA